MCAIVFDEQIKRPQSAAHTHARTHSICARLRKGYTHDTHTHVVHKELFWVRLQCPTSVFAHGLATNSTTVARVLHMKIAFERTYPVGDEWPQPDCGRRTLYPILYPRLFT